MTTTVQLRRNLAFAALAVIHIALTNSALGQSIPSDFVLDRSKPFTFLKFDHIGPRKPLGNETGNLGIWLRVVNNCRYPIVVPTDGAGVLDQIIVMKPDLIIASSPPLETEDERWSR